MLRVRWNGRVDLTSTPLIFATQAFGFDFENGLMWTVVARPG